MDLFQRAKAVRLRSFNDKYLLAEEDEEGVCQGRKGSTQRARWEVEFVEDDKSLIRLKSCYGKYLSASNQPFLLGLTGHKVLQVSPSRLDSSIAWEPVRDGFQVKLKTRFGHFLRANGGPPPWRNSVTHDIPHLHKEWVLWEVDIIGIRTCSPVADQVKSAVEFSVSSSPSISNQESFSSSISVSSLNSLSHSECGSPCISDVRSIRCMVANNDGNVEDGAEEFSFAFEGTSVEELTHRLEEATELGQIIVCSRNPVNGKLYPLHLHLPPNKSNVNVVLVLASSKVARSFMKRENHL
ncbi:hypothetical protein HPP92_001606 [Vanilla planifolia]|uniref:DUF569 domain-containing protein n=1 Tax=Vanilla planifolia TaxID=51239 RepID=A0A835VFQ2_VANPL|nr:hypothetical protein HPP92_001828 [Vanilla planifolia]KAG0501534.1 hypothetical protein HPP92_001606 [Vanilla planifolia]